MFDNWEIQVLPEAQDSQDCPPMPGSCNVFSSSSLRSNPANARSGGSILCSAPALSYAPNSAPAHSEFFPRHLGIPPMNSQSSRPFSVGLHPSINTQVHTLAHLYPLPAITFPDLVMHSGPRAPFLLVPLGSFPSYSIPHVPPQIFAAWQHSQNTSLAPGLYEGQRYDHIEHSYGYTDILKNSYQRPVYTSTGGSSVRPLHPNLSVDLYTAMPDSPLRTVTHPDVLRTRTL